MCSSALSASGSGRELAHWSRAMRPVQEVIGEGEKGVGHRLVRGVVKLQIAGMPHTSVLSRKAM